jgi:GT2 family glycosyltransferase
MTTISFAITAYNEHVELERLLDFLKDNVRQEDEVVIQLDDKHTQEVLRVCNSFVNFIPNLKFYTFGLNNNFAAFRNNLTKSCTKDYIFHIDADEIPSIDLISSLPRILENNLNIDVFLTPRVNIVEGLTQEHIKKWGWNVNKEEWINWPDYQWRIYKNSPEIQWMNKVHERLFGFGEFIYLPDEETYSLYHFKSIERQEKQNQFYNTL